MAARLSRIAVAGLVALSVTGLGGCGADLASHDGVSASSSPAASARATTGTPPGSAGSASVPGPATRPAPSTPAAGTGSGVTGVIVVDGGCPVVRLDSPCPDRPLQARLTVTDAASGTVMITVETDPAGQFRIPLRPGRYTVRATTPSGGLLPRAAPTTVTVVSGRYTTLTIRFDSGIR